MDQFKSTYPLNKRSKIWFYLRLFFDLHDVTCMRAFIIYKKLENNKAYSKKFQSAHYWNDNCFISQQEEFLIAHPSFCENFLQVLIYHSTCQFSLTLAVVALCTQIPSCSTCDASLCLLKDKTCFAEYHQYSNLENLWHLLCYDNLLFIIV